MLWLWYKCLLFGFCYGVRYPGRPDSRLEKKGRTWNGSHAYWSAGSRKNWIKGGISQWCQERRCNELLMKTPGLLEWGEIKLMLRWTLTNKAGLRKLMYSNPILVPRKTKTPLTPGYLHMIISRLTCLLFPALFLFRSLLSPYRWNPSWYHVRHRCVAWLRAHRLWWLCCGQHGGRRIQGLPTRFLRIRQDCWEEVVGLRCSPICAHTISVKAPINWGVALVLRRSDSSSTILPMENQRAALRRCWGFVSSQRCLSHVKAGILTSRRSSSIWSVMLSQRQQHCQVNMSSWWGVYLWIWAWGFGRRDAETMRGNFKIRKVWNYLMPLNSGSTRCIPKWIKGGFQLESWGIHPYGWMHQKWGCDLKHLLLGSED